MYPQKKESSGVKSGDLRGWECGPLVQSIYNDCDYPILVETALEK